ncbi:hypothetical protein RJT34_10656 [Clitoria ternatea]|uniref:Uncharacterized protein n=1 Tax=Clitoria ternatea TaxID=43366 RepID=A0AAN9JJ21_CLITE
MYENVISTITLFLYKKEKKSKSNGMWRYMIHSDFDSLGLRGPKRIFLPTPFPLSYKLLSFSISLSLLRAITMTKPFNLAFLF